MIRNALMVLGAWMLLQAGTVAADNTKPYRGAEIYSNQSYLYGRFEMRMRVASGSGVLSTFFTYKNGSEIGNTFWEEIDIEVFGKNNAEHWQSNIILGSSRPTIMSEADHAAPGSLAEAYHTYVLEWTPDYVAWFLDGEEVRRITGTSTVTSLTSEQSLRFNIWASDSVPWVGAWDDSILPVYQFVDYLIYQPYDAVTKTFTDSGGWRDDFEAFNNDRWGKADWTFGGNRVTFSPENVVIKDGILVLALTHKDAEGYIGTPPQDTPASSESSASSVASSGSSSAASASSTSSSSAVSSAASSSSTTTSVASFSSSAAAKSGGGGGSMNMLSLWWLGVLAFVAHARRR